jgi:glucosamine--fructose-6-phosphate aminotransferase (isomerizing)
MSESTQPGAFSWREITTQGEAWRGGLEAALAKRREVEALWAAHAQRPVCFIGCGSTHCLAQFCAPFFQRATGMRALALPSSELLFQAEPLTRGMSAPLVVALSRSGETSETIWAAEKLRALGSPVVLVSCYEDTPLAACADCTIVIPEGREQSFAQTRSFAGMLVAVQTMAALIAADRALLADLQVLPSLADELIARAQPLAERLGAEQSYQRITYLGSGALYGLAAEATIKMKEMSLSIAEAFHFMEFRHGPMALVDEEHLIVGLVAERTRAHELSVLRELQGLGGRIAALAETDAGLGQPFADCLFLRSAR